MNTFFKTFFICLAAVFALLAYKLLSNGYSPDLIVSKNNPVFGTHEELNDAKPTKNPALTQSKPETKPQQETKKQQKYIHYCYFYSVNGKLTRIERELSAKPSIRNSILLLLKGPTIPETKQGIYSEIPANVDLISVKRENNSVIVDLTSNFGNGGGTQSVENRVKQLSKTVKEHTKNENVYLYINGKEVEYLGGEGVYIKQPLD